eukprot:1161812-Pelagomonas_calceolata.AAC.1
MHVEWHPKWEAADMLQIHPDLHVYVCLMQGVGEYAVVWQSLDVAGVASELLVPDDNSCIGEFGKHFCKIWVMVKPAHVDVAAEASPVRQEHEGGNWFVGLEGGVHCMAQELEHDFVFMRRMAEGVATGSTCGAVPVLIGLARFPVLQQAYFEFVYEAAPVVRAVTESRSASLLGMCFEWATFSPSFWKTYKQREEKQKVEGRWRVRRHVGNSAGKRWLFTQKTNGSDAQSHPDDRPSTGPGGPLFLHNTDTMQWNASDIHDELKHSADEIKQNQDVEDILPTGIERGKDGKQDSLPVPANSHCCDIGTAGFLTLIREFPHLLIAPGG